jgi:GNAT superfamily N-acetyltransferase
MSDLEIRPARADDLIALTRSRGQRRFFADCLARQEDGRGLLLTAWLNSEPIGGIYLRFEPADEPEIRDRLPGIPLLNRLQVVTAHRNRGIGTTILGAAEQVLTEMGHERVALAVELGNEGAATLYQRLGYEVWPWPPVWCANKEPLPDGGRDDGEWCDVLVKRLRDRHVDGPE